jgi:hypothetical protein
MRLFHGTIEALSTARNSERNAFTVVDETVGWAKLLRVQAEVRELADLAGEDPLQAQGGDSNSAGAPHPARNRVCSQIARSAETLTHC